MIKKIKNLVLTLMMSGSLLAPVAVPATVLAQADANLQGDVACGTEFNITGTGCAASDTAAENRVQDTIRLVINIFSIVVGLVSVIMIIVGGFKYILSGGESSNVTSARNTIMYAVIGLVIVALAQIVVRFVLSRAASTT